VQRVGGGATKMSGEAATTSFTSHERKTPLPEKSRLLLLLKTCN